MIVHILQEKTNRRINMTHFARRKNVNHFFFNKMSSCHFGEARRFMNSQRFKSAYKLAPEVITNKKTIFKFARYNTASPVREILQQQLNYWKSLASLRLMKMAKLGSFTQNLLWKAAMAGECQSYCLSFSPSSQGKPQVILMPANMAPFTVLQLAPFFSVSRVGFYAPWHIGRDPVSLSKNLGGQRQSFKTVLGWTAFLSSC